MPPMQLLIKPASGMCNLRCRYCFYHDVAQNREQESYGLMSLDTLEQIVKKSLEYADGSCNFAFQGGEPTLVGLAFYQELILLQRKYNKKQVTIDNALQTNGYLLDEQWAKFLAENHFLVGLSLDGIKATHDAYRINSQSDGTFAQIMKTTEMFQKYGVEFNILTVVNSKTAAKTQKIYQFYQKNNLRHLQFIACLDPLEEEPGKRDYSLTPEAYGRFLIELFDLWFLDLEHGRQPYIRQFENMVAILLGQEPESCEQRGFCSIQHVVEADGSVYPCDFYVMDQYRIGNFCTDSVAQIRQNGLDSQFIQQSAIADQECLGCRYYTICRGGCGRHRMDEAGARTGRNYFCQSYQMFYEAALPRLKMIADRIRYQS